MEETRLNHQNEDVDQESSPEAPEALRRETRRRLLKAGLMCIPVIMTVHSRPALALTNGSVDLQSYGGYPAQNDITEAGQSEADPYGENVDPSVAPDDFSFQRSRNPRGRSNR
jgi:hypothetical protein